MMQPMSLPQEPTPLALGERLEGYEIERVLSRSRFTYSYEARTVVGGSKVVINEFLPHEFAVRDGMVLRARDIEDRNALRWWMRSFLDRAGQLQSMSHPGLVKVLRNFEANGTGYYVTEGSNGETLATLLEREGTLNEAQLRRILASILGGLERAHSSGLIHRDLRPQNIWLRPNGTAALADFGILRAPIRFKSKTLTTGAVPPYSAPEEFVLNGGVGTWSDIYALGAIAYRAVSGQDPIDARERERGAFLALASQVVRVRASDMLLGGIDAALQLNPPERPQTVAAWSEMLQLDLNTAVAPVGPSSKGGAQPPAKTGSGSKNLALVLVPLLAIAAAAAYFVFLKPGPASPATATAAATPLPAVTAPAIAPAATQAGGAASATPANATQTAPAPAATPPAANGDLDKLVQELMARDKKAQAEIKEQQRLLDLQKQAGLKASAKTTDSTAASASKGRPSAVESKAATAEPAAGLSDDAKHAKELEEEIGRLRAEQDARKKVDATATSAVAPKAEDQQDAASRAEYERARQKAIIAKARQNCRIPAMDLSPTGDLTYENAMRVAGAEKLGSGAIRLTDITLSDGRTENFLITPDSCARMER